MALLQGTLLAVMREGSACFPSQTRVAALGFDQPCSQLMQHLKMY